MIDSFLSLVQTLKTETFYSLDTMLTNSYTLRTTQYVMLEHHVVTRPIINKIVSEDHDICRLYLCIHRPRLTRTRYFIYCWQFAAFKYWFPDIFEKLVTSA